MARRLRRDLHKRISAAGYEKISGDLEVTGDIIGPSIGNLVTAISKLVTFTTTPVKLTITSCTGFFKAIVVRWPQQYNLANFLRYELQVSADAATWYGLQFDGTDWKAGLGGVTPSVAQMMVHVPIPFGGTAADPTAVTLYYRVRQVTVLEVYGAWSDPASATTSLLQNGDIAANVITANKILASEINTMLLRATAAVIIGQDFTGDPYGGAQRVVVDDNEFRLEEWSGSAWVEVTRLGGDDQLKWYLSARGLIRPGTDISGLSIGDRSPAAAAQFFDFDNDALDQNGVDPWEAKSNVAYDSALKRFGAYSLKHAAGYVGFLRDDSALSITNTDFGIGGYHYKPAGTTERMLLALVKDGAWQSGTIEGNNWADICWSPELGLFCAVSWSGTYRVATSPDGVTWTSRAAAAGEWYGVCWSAELALFCAVGYNSGTYRVMTSPNGINWTGQTADANNWFAVTWSAELALFCAVAGSGTYRVMTSPNGINWTGQTAAEANNWLDICWSRELGLFCAVATTGTYRVMTSSNGIAWTGQSAAAANLWCGVAWSPELRLFCAVATSTSAVMTSPDAVTWTGQTPAEANAWREVAWSPGLGLFCAVAVGGTNRSMVSKDGVNWTTKSAAAVLEWRALCWGAGPARFAAVANGGTNPAMAAALAGMRLYETSTGYKLIVGASVIQERVATASVWHHVGITVRDDAGQQKWGLAVDAWSTEVNIAAHPIATASWLLLLARDGSRLDDWLSLAGAATFNLAKMLSHYAAGQPWVDYTTGTDYALDLILMAKAGGQIKFLSPTSPAGFALTVVDVTSVDYDSAQYTDNWTIVNVNSSSARAVDIASGADAAGKLVTIISKNTGVITLTVTAGAATVAMNRGDSLTLVWDGTNWNYIASTNLRWTYTSGTSQTWKPPWTGAFVAKAQGGGNSGAAGSASTYAGGGGGGGGCAIKKYNLVANTACTYSVGAAAAASSFTDGTVAITGTAGAAGSTGTGGAGGVPTSGDLNLPGGDGGSGIYTGVGGLSFAAPGGSGGNSHLGKGGRGGYNTGAGVAGKIYGGGGGGGSAMMEAGTAGAGAAGAAGVVIIEAAGAAA